MSPLAIKHPGPLLQLRCGLPSQGSARGVRSKTAFTKACKALAAARSGDWLGDGLPITR
jgi:hypothetical protein